MSGSPAVVKAVYGLLLAPLTLSSAVPISLSLPANVEFTPLKLYQSSSVPNSLSNPMWIVISSVVPNILSAPGCL